jgi:hypothetical protein
LDQAPDERNPEISQIAFGTVDRHQSHLASRLSRPSAICREDYC